MKMSIRSTKGLALAALGILVAFYSCRHQAGQTHQVVLDDGGYPDAVNRIVMLHCTTGPTGGGCHNAVGAENAGGLRMDTWDHLFDGSNHGATVVPYDTVNSSLLYFISPDSSLGPIVLPTMPYTGTNYSTTPLTRDEYLTIHDWIAAGAPDKNGNIPFGDNADSRQKIYITQQGSDILSVVDAARHVVMRNIPIGMVNNIESPHCVRVSKDGRFAYVSFLAGDYVQKIDTRTDQVVGSVKLSDGDASWNVVHLSEDGTKLLATDFLHGKLMFVNTTSMQVTQTILSNVANPHGIASTPGFDTFFITAQYGNTVFKLYPDGNYKLVSIDGAPSTYSPNVRDPHEIMMSPDYSRYFLTCEYSNEIRVMDTHSDTLIATIPVPKKPQDMAISHTKPYLFITCMEAASTTPGAYGAVVIINYETMQIVKIIYGDFWQPHGVTVDDQAGTFYVASTNQTGPSVGHNHTSGGKHGWYNVYSLETLDPLIKRQYETLVLPYSADSRFKP
jgi:YVTN family beta-propeller protein